MQIMTQSFVLFEIGKVSMDRQRNPQINDGIEGTDPAIFKPVHGNSIYLIIEKHERLGVRTGTGNKVCLWSS